MAVVDPDINRDVRDVTLYMPSRAAGFAFCERARVSAAIAQAQRMCAFCLRRDRGHQRRPSVVRGVQRVDIVTCVEPLAGRIAGGPCQSAEDHNTACAVRAWEADTGSPTRRTWRP